MLKSEHRSIVDLRVNVFVFGSFVFVKKEVRTRGKFVTSFASRFCRRSMRFFF